MPALIMPKNVPIGIRLGFIGQASRATREAVT